MIKAWYWGNLLKPGPSGDSLLQEGDFKTDRLIDDAGEGWPETRCPM